MNEILKAIHERQSLRAFDDRPVGDDVRRQILEAAVRAPSAGALQLYAILEVDDQEKKDELAVLCDNQPFIARSPWVVLFLADYQRLADNWRELRLAPTRPMGMGDLMLCVDDALIAAQNAVIAAEALGLGSCYIGDIMENEDKVRRLLNLPAHVFPASMLCFGYKKPGFSRLLTPRLPLEAVLHKDSYQSKPMPRGEFEERMIRRALEKFNADFSVEMSRSVETWMRAWPQE